MPRGQPERVRAQQMLSSRRIAYGHPGVAAPMTLVGGIALGASIGYLWRQLARDRWVAASADVGTRLATMVPVSGLWGGPGTRPSRPLSSCGCCFGLPAAAGLDR